jgi:2-methylisocitrate lyase-like PEP mutase family enzyme
MPSFRSLLNPSQPLLIPGAHDALTARMIENAGFPAYGIGGAALAATQMALPDAGLQSFGEYRDAVARIMQGSTLPVMVDGENGFGDAKAITRTVRLFERMGVGALSFEDLTFPPIMGARPTVMSRREIRTKLEAALAAREGKELMIVGRTDAAYVLGLDEALQRVREFEQSGVDAVLATGVQDLAGYQALRSTTKLPIIAVIIPGSPWFAPTRADLQRIGIEAALYPAAILTRIMQAVNSGLKAIREADGAPPPGFDMRTMGAPLRAEDWIAIDQRFYNKPDAK